MTYSSISLTPVSEHSPPTAAHVFVERASAGDTQHSQEVPSAPIKNHSPALSAENIDTLLSEITPDLDNCRDTLAANKKALGRYVTAQDSQVKSSQKHLSDMAGTGDGDENPTRSPHAHSLAPVTFDKGWQVYQKSGTDKLNGIAALEESMADSLSPLARGVDDASAPRLGLDDKTPKSYREIWQEAVEGIGSIKEGYLEVYETVVERYTTFYSSFSDFMSGLSGYITVKTDDKGNQTMEFKPEVMNKLNELINTYSGDKGVLFPASGTTTKAEADKWAAELGLPANCVQLSGSGYVVKLDISPLTTIRDNLNDTALKPMNTFQYQSWRSGFDAQSGKFQTTLQTLTTKYGNANGMFDTMVKVLSSIITSGSETLKQILASI